TGGHATGILSLANSGVGELTYSVEVEGARVTTGVASPGAVAPALAPRPRFGRDSRTSTVTPPGDPAPSPGAYVAGRVPVRAPSSPPIGFAPGAPAATGDRPAPGPQANAARILILESGGEVSEIQHLLAAFDDVTAVDVFDG